MNESSLGEPGQPVDFTKGGMRRRFTLRMDRIALDGVPVLFRIIV